MSRKPLLVRADASTAMGTGHVMRCLALAQAWQDGGGRVVFAMADVVPALSERLRNEGIEIESVVAQKGTQEDAHATAGLAEQVGAEWVVVDGYHFSGDYQRGVKGAGFRVLAVDDYGHAGHYWADAVLNQNLGACEALYASREPGTHLLLGPSFVLLRGEFRIWQGWQRPIPKVARKILVTLGGSDPDNATLSVIRALHEAPVNDLEAVVLVGAANPYRAVLESSIQNPSIRLRSSVTDVSGLMAWADAAIVAGGSTAWEVALLGLPSLMLVIADNQHEVARAADAAGFAINLGPAADSGPVIADQLARLCTSEPLRARMAQCGRVVDGRGAERVCSHMDSVTNVTPVRLRPIEKDDCRLIWEWANDPEVREVSFTQEPIPWARHVEWFAARLADPNCLFYLAVEPTGRPVGQLRYSLEGEDAIVSVSLARSARGNGYGPRVLALGSEQLFRTTNARRIHAHVKSTNVASLRAFYKAGFTTHEWNEQKAVHLILNRAA